MDVLRADLFVARHRQASAGRSHQVPGCRRHLEDQHEEDLAEPPSVGVHEEQEAAGQLGLLHQSAGYRFQGPQPVLGRQTSQLPQVLLPEQRRAAGDPVGSEGPAARPAAPEEVLRRNPEAEIRRGKENPWDVFN